MVQFYNYKLIVMFNCLSLFLQYFEALDLCVEHNVWVTEELAERFTLPKDEKARNQILEKVAECAYAQENYKLATKKFTQAGNKVSTMMRCCSLSLCTVMRCDTVRACVLYMVCIRLNLLNLPL